ncbi:DNA sulfur modification protein DndD [Virgibacillus sediminis]|uniref:Nuclease SbcCD subunit C n=1 Tax=Virgibacillus sediminis TaxID=202260 RepID=A0ABV7A4H5_9BACI
MILKKIILNNIGPYEGKNIFDLHTDDRLNTVLIGGKNGSGKTTFLNSVRLALYGPLAYKKKTVTPDYLKKIKSLMNANAMKQQNGSLKEYENEFYIQIDFTIIESFQRINVSIIRSWTIGPNIKENVSVIKEGVEVSEVEKDQFFSHLRTTFPPSLLELCFFDGEEISHLTDEDNLSQYLKVLSSKIFNLDLFQNLEQDMYAYLDQSSTSKEQTRLEQEEKEYEEALNQSIRDLQEVRGQIENTESEITVSKQRYNKVKNDFSLHGGIAYEERTRLQEKINEIEVNRKHINEKIKEFIANELPFFIAFPQLYKLVVQLKNEEEFHVSNILKNKIDKLPVNQIMGELGVQSTNNTEEKLKESLVTHLAKTEEVNIIHNASKTEAQQVYNLLSQTSINRLNVIVSLIQENQKLLSDVQSNKKKLKDNEESPEFADMIQSMEEYTRSISELEERLNSLKNQENELRNEIEIVNKKFEKIKQQLYKIRKTKSSFDESQKIIQISQRFQQHQLRNKIKDIEYFSSKMFKELIRKKEFIHHILIDPKTFQLSILDHNSERIDKDILSAGEKELLALSIIWGTIMSSKKELPLILDTLLGRLDNEHKHSIVTNLLPKFGVQNIVLSTDSEIDANLYKDLKYTIANVYTLNYDSSNRKTEIERHFFNLENEKVTK